MAKAGVVFNNLGFKQTKQCVSEEKLLNWLLEDHDGDSPSIFKLNEIYMTEQILATDSTVEHKASTEHKED